MVWAGVWSGGYIGPFFFAGNVNGESYLRLLRTKVVPALEAHGVLNTVFFQHDGASPHHTAPVMDYLNSVFGERIIGRTSAITWPTNSPDLTPPDFYLWSRINEQVQKKEPPNVRTLKDDIRNEFRTLTVNEIRRSVLNTQKRMNQCIRRGGKQVGKGLKS
ncbi:unnamed protein product [Allacma fusca]|uniref:Transposase n=1 Tax=Allacma fusca TaxID=39272 RepID=A0A8J2KSX9_9HEXA|nr:unnamed protein product [Allacma fusca]